MKHWARGTELYLNISEYMAEQTSVMFKLKSCSQCLPNECLFSTRSMHLMKHRNEHFNIILRKQTVLEL